MVAAMMYFFEITPNKEGGESELVEALGKGEVSVRDILEKLSPENDSIKEDDSSRFFKFRKKIFY